MRVVGRVVDTVEMHQIRAVSEYRQRFDFAAVREAAAIVAVEFGRNIARLHGEYRHAVFAMQRFGGDRQRRDVAFMPVDDEQVLGAVLRGGLAGFGDHAHISIRRQCDGAFERHVHGRHAERRRRQQQPVHALGDRVAYDLARVDVGAGRQVRAMLLDAAGGQDDERILLQLLRDLGLREVAEVAGG